MGHTSSYFVLSIPISRYLIKSYLTQLGQPLELRFSDLYNYLGVCVSSTQTPQVISRIVRTHMTNVDPVSVSSDGEVYTVSSSSGRAAARVISVMSSSASWPETIEHVESSGFDRHDPLALHEAREEAARMATTGFEQEDSLALREAREEAARMALEMSAARLRHQELQLEATTARLQLLEARERSHRASPASISSLQGSAPTPPAPPVIELPIDDRLRPPTWTANRLGQTTPTRNEEDGHRRLAMMMGRPPQRVTMSPDRAWWMDDQDSPHHHEDKKGRPEEKVHDPKDDRIRELEERIRRLKSERVEPMMTASSSSQEHAVPDLQSRAREATEASPTKGVDIGAGVGSLHTMLESVFITPQRSDDLIDLGSPRRAYGNGPDHRDGGERAGELPLPRNLDADMHHERVRAETARQTETVNLLMLTPPRAQDNDQAFQTTDALVHSSGAELDRELLHPAPHLGEHPRELIHARDDHLWHPQENLHQNSSVLNHPSEHQPSTSDAHEQMLAEQVSQLRGQMDALHQILNQGSGNHLNMDAPPGLEAGHLGGPPPRPDEEAVDPDRGVNAIHNEELKIVLKEGDSMKVPPIPEPARLTQWKQSVRDSVVTTSGRGQEAFRWILQAEDFQVPDENLEPSVQYASVDAKLGKAFSDILGGRAGGRIGTIITDAKERAAAEGRRLPGRLIYRMILRQFNVNRNKGHLHDLMAFKTISFTGDDALERFLDSWEEMLNGLYRVYPDEDLELHLFEHLKGSTKLKAALDRYKLAEIGHPDKTYRFLYHALTQYVDMERDDRISKAIMEDRMRRLSGAKPRQAMPAQSAEMGNEAGETERLPPPTPQQAAPAVKKKEQHCFNFREGKCARGSACPYQHDRKFSAEELKNLKEKRGKTPCKLHAMGKCKYGSKCQFLHAESASAAAACTEVRGGNVEKCEFPDDADGDRHVEMAVPAFDIMDPQEWLLDTGTENHLVSRQYCHEDQVYESDRPLNLQTANGVITVNSKTQKRITALSTKAEAVVLDQTPNALSVGRLVSDGCSFHWPARGDAYLIDKAGNKIMCETKGYVPVLKEDVNQTCMPCEGEEAPEVEDTETKEERLKREAESPQHLLCHMPKNPYCWVCGMSDITMSPARRVTAADGRISTSSFGEHVCLDHIVLMKESAFGMNGERAALLILDMHSRFMACVPVPDKSANAAFHALKYFLGDCVATKIYSDNSWELAAAAAWVNEQNGHHSFHQTSTPHRPQSNAFVERAIRTLLRAARGALVQAGLPHRFWPWAARHQAFAISINDRPGGQPSPWWITHGENFAGWVLPFGSLVFYRPPRPILKNLPKFSPRGVPGIFAGWHVEPGCGFRGDYYVIPLSSFRTANKKSYHAHRVKEIMSFDATKFPLQQAGLDDLLSVKPDFMDGPDVMPSEINHGVANEDGDGITSSEIDREYQAVLGSPPPDHLSHEEKQAAIEKELFGDDDQDDGWGNFGVPNTPEDHEESDPGEHEDDDGDASEHGSADSDDGWHERWMKRSEETHDAEPMDAVHPPPEASSSSRPPDADLPAVRRVKWNLRSSAKKAAAWTTDPSAKRDHAYVAMVAEEVTAEVSAPARKLTKMSDRRLVEDCCSQDSILGHRRYIEAGCASFRLTIQDDLTTQQGLDRAMEAVEGAAADEYIHLWGALPCTGGSPWQNLNKRYPSARAKIRMHLATFQNSGRWRGLSLPVAAT